MWKIILSVSVITVAALVQYEVEDDVLLVEKEVVLPVTRAKAFMYISDLTNLKYVGVAN